jgi:hypothetical protein
MVFKQLKYNEAINGRRELLVKPVYDSDSKNPVGNINRE